MDGLQRLIIMQKLLIMCVCILWLLDVPFTLLVQLLAKIFHYFDHVF